VIERLADWARGRPSRPALLIRAALGATEPDDPALRLVLATELDALSVAPHLTALAWRAIELMDLAPPDEGRLDALTTALTEAPAAELPLLLPNGARITDAETAQIAGEALALRALTKGHRGGDAPIRARLDDLARRGPGSSGVTRRASALHGIAADAVHYPTAVETLAEALAGVQHSDGSWGGDELFHVGQALLAVEHPIAGRALKRGLKALEAQQRADGSFGTEERSWIACRWLVRVGSP
jgi:hypothetical protein